MRYIVFLSFLLISVLAVAEPERALLRLKSGVVRFELPNGLRVVYYRRTVSPIFAGQIWVGVGGVNEVAGATGIAHFLEHMAFKGTDTIGAVNYQREKRLLERIEELLAPAAGDGEMQRKILAQDEAKKILSELDSLVVDNEFGKRYSLAGEVGLNAATSKDYTMYTVSLPAVAFELWCQMESDRLLNPVFRQVYKEREVVLEERRTGYDDDPGGKIYEALLQLSYTMHPYRLPLIGWSSDVSSITARQIQQFYEEYYRPDNMVISLVGDLEESEVRRLVAKYFSRLKKREAPLPTLKIQEPPQSGERFAEIQFDAEPQFAIAYHKPVYPNKDDAYFAILHSILGEGRSSIFEKELVRQKRIAASIISTEAPGERYPSLFIVAGAPTKKHSNDELIEAVDRIFDRLREQTVDSELVMEAKRRVRMGLLTSLDSNSGLASALGKSELFWRDWGQFLTVYDDIESTSPADIKRLVNTYLTRENRSIVQIKGARQK